MTLHPIPLNFLIYEERFIFFFISVPGEEVSPGVSVESHGILHCELLEEEVHTGLTHTLHTAQQFYRLDGFERLVLVGSVTKMCLWCCKDRRASL
jgi:hypothetical protein